MKVKRIRMYFIPVVLCFACVLSGCSSNVTSDNQNNTVKKEKNSTLEGTWKVKDFQDTIKQLSQVGANRVDVEKRIKNFYNDFDMTLTITNDNAVLHYTFDVKKLYEYYFNNFEKGIYEDLEQYTNKKRTSFNVNYNVLEHTQAIRDGDKIDYTLKNGEIDEDRKTITFPETPSIDSEYLLGNTTYNDETNPVIYSYSIENNELTLTVTEKDVKGKEYPINIKFTKEN